MKGWCVSFITSNIIKTHDKSQSDDVRCQLRGEKYREAITTDVSEKITAVQAARELLRGFLDDEKVAFWSWSKHRSLKTIFNFQWATHSPVLNCMYKTTPEPWNFCDINPPSSTWKVDVLPQATDDLKAALDEMDKAMLPAKKAKAPAPKSAAVKESWSTSLIYIYIIIYIYIFAGISYIICSIYIIIYIYIFIIYIYT